MPISTVYYIIVRVKVLTFIGAHQKIYIFFGGCILWSEKRCRFFFFFAEFRTKKGLGHSHQVVMT